MMEFCHNSHTDLPLETSQVENADHASFPPISQFDDADCGSWRHAPNPGCHASFGDQMATATVGAFGQLLQFSCFLGAGSSGMFSADHEGIREPYSVCWRASQLEELSQRSFHYDPVDEYANVQPYGLRFAGLILNTDIQPELKWTHWRWPRYEYSPGAFMHHPKLRMTIQWMVHQGTVLQQCLLENEGDDFELEVAFSKSMMIRDLDHLNPKFKFNEEEIAEHDTRPGPKGYSWICAHKFQDTKIDSETAESHSEPLSGGSGEVPSERQKHNPRSHKPGSKSSDGVSVACSVAINGKIRSFESNTSLQRWSVPSQLRQMGEAGCQTHAFEVITAYKMRLLDGPKTDWTTHIIPWNDMEVIRFVHKQQPPQPVPDRSPAPSRHPMPAMRQARDKSSHEGDIKSPEDPNKLSKDKKGGAKSRAPMQYVSTGVPVGTPGKSSPPENPGSPQNHLEFAARRNLEHILSVCTVRATPEASHTTNNNPLPERLNHVQAVALTCGDMSGHRICWSASL